VNTTMVLPLVGRSLPVNPSRRCKARDNFSRRFVRSKEVFVLEVRGDSMQDRPFSVGTM